MTQISEAAKSIKDGKVVAFPTETVWGLGANAFDEKACQNIYRLKGRPSNNPLIIHVANIEDAEKLVIFNEDAYKLSALMPGPLTLVLPKRPDTKIAPSVCAGLPTLAIRIPVNNTARKLIEQAGVPIAAPSANKSNYISSTKLHHILSQFNVEIERNEISILENLYDEQCYGLESTIIDCSSPDQLTMLRSGFILPETIQTLSNLPLTAHNNSKVIAPGMMKKHYSPKAPLRLNATNFNENEIAINFGDISLDNTISLSITEDLTEAAANLYSALHAADQTVSQHPEIDSIAVSPIPNHGIGIAINDRLNRAAT